MASRRRPSPSARSRSGPSQYKQGYQDESESQSEVSWPVQPPKSSHSLTSFDHWGNSLEENFDFNQFTFEFPTNKSTSYCSQDDTTSTVVTESTVQTQSYVGHNHGEDAESRMFMYRTSPDRASVGAVRRRREHAKQLADAIDEPREGGTPIAQLKSGRRQPSPQGRKSTQQPVQQQPFWHSSNGSVGSGSNNSAFNMTSILEEEQPQRSQHLRQNSVESSDIPTGVTEDNISEIGPFSGMVVGKTKKKKKSSAIENKAAAKAAHAQQMNIHKQHMKVMAEEAAARSRASGHAPEAVPLSSKCDFTDEGFSNDMSSGMRNTQSNIYQNDRSTTTSWEVDFSSRAKPQPVQPEQESRQQQYLVRKSAAPPWSKRYTPKTQQPSSVPALNNDAHQPPVNKQSPRRPSPLRDMFYQRMQQKKEEVANHHVRDSVKPPSPTRHSTLPESFRPNLQSTRSEDVTPDDEKANSQLHQYARSEISASPVVNASLLKQRFAREREKKLLQKNNREHAPLKDRTPISPPRKSDPTSAVPKPQINAQKSTLPSNSSMSAAFISSRSHHNESKEERILKTQKEQVHLQANAVLRTDSSDSGKIKTRHKVENTHSQQEGSRKVNPYHTNETAIGRKKFFPTNDKNEDEDDLETAVEDYQNVDRSYMSNNTRQSNIPQSIAEHQADPLAGRFLKINLGAPLPDTPVPAEASMSPVETCTSSLTSSTVDFNNNGVKMNPFKEMAGFHVSRKNVAEEHTESFEPPSSRNLPWKKSIPEEAPTEGDFEESKPFWARGRRASPPPQRDINPTPLWMKSETGSAEANDSGKANHSANKKIERHFGQYTQSEPGGGRSSPSSTTAKKSWRERATMLQNKDLIIPDGQSNTLDPNENSGGHSGFRRWRPPSLENAPSSAEENVPISNFNPRQRAASPVSIWSQKRSNLERTGDDNPEESAFQSSQQIHHINDALNSVQKPSRQEISREKQNIRQDPESRDNQEHVVIQNSFPKTWQQKLRERQAAARNGQDSGDDETASFDSAKRGAQSDFVVGSTVTSMQSSPVGLAINSKLKTHRRSPRDGETPPFHPNTPRINSPQDPVDSGNFLSNVKLKKSNGGGLAELIKQETSIFNIEEHPDSLECSPESRETDNFFGNETQNMTNPVYPSLRSDPPNVNPKKKKSIVVNTTLLQQLDNQTPGKYGEEESTCCDSLQVTIQGGGGNVSEQPVKSSQHMISSKDALHAALLKRAGNFHSKLTNRESDRHGNGSNSRYQAGEIERKLGNYEYEDETNKSPKDVLNAALLQRLGAASRKIATDSSHDAQNNNTAKENLQLSLLDKNKTQKQEEEIDENSQRKVLSPKDILNASLLKRSPPQTNSVETLNENFGESDRAVVHAALLKRSAPQSNVSDEGTKPLNGQKRNETNSGQEPPFGQQIDPILAKYFKMLKVGMPEEVVRHAMTRDGVDPDLLNGQVHTSVGSSITSPTRNQDTKHVSSRTVINQDPINVSLNSAPLKEDPMYQKYFKMLKMGLPPDAVKHSMVRDGVDPSVLDGIHSPPLPQKSSGSPALKDDPKYEKYFKMLKMGLPLDAVKHAMSRDGLDPSVMDGTAGSENTSKQESGGFGLGSAAALKASMAKITKSSAKPKDTIRRMRIHWEAMHHESIANNSVWAMLTSDPEVEQLDIDESEFKELFQAEIQEKKELLKSQESSKTNVVKVIDAKRANNGGIILARVKMSFGELADSIERL